uniref:Uncharacterized protein n=1 Tax=Romanomermis culicivorax TaxID=13658 RepID=A0A915ICX2_ROMCU
MFTLTNAYGSFDLRVQKSYQSDPTLIGIFNNDETEPRTPPTSPPTESRGGVGTAATAQLGKESKEFRAKQQGDVLRLRFLSVEDKLPMWMDSINLFTKNRRLVFLILVRQYLSNRAETSHELLHGCIEEEIDPMSDER